jgi:two-component system NarL family response regulator
VNAQPDMTVVAEVINGEEAVASFTKYQPDITLIDMRMPGMSGFEAVGAIYSQFPRARIIALSTFGGDEDIRRALMAGAKSYLTKDVLHDELLGAIRAVHAGQTYLPAAVKATLDAEKLHSDLSVRELEVLELIVQGLSNKQLAWHLRIAEETAKSHVKNILKKLGADDRTQAATRAIQRGIIHLD